MKWARFPNLAARPAKPSLNQGPYPSACSSRAVGAGRGLDEPNQRMDASSRPQPAHGQLAAGIGAEGTANADNNETGRRHDGIMALLARI
jgi:hypothetical protein